MRGPNRQKNVIHILIDSFWYGYINNNSLGIPIMPFLDNISKEWIVAENVFASGPYTESGIRGVLNGINTLDNGGYHLQLGQEDDNYIKLFSDNNYIIYDHIYPNYLLSKETRKLIDHPIYVRGVGFKSIWRARSEYFYQKYKCGNLSNRNYQELIKLFQGYISSWKDVFETYFSHREAFCGIEKQVEHYNFTKNYNVLLEEEKKFVESPKKYIDRILNEKENSRLWSIESFDSKLDVNYEGISRLLGFGFRLKLKILHLYMSLFKSDFKYLDGCKNLIKYIRFRKEEDKEYIGSFKRTLFMYKDYDAYKMRREISYGPSLRHQFKIAIKQLVERGEDRPFFYSIKSEEMHYFHKFCSVDCWDNHILAGEIFEMKRFVKKIKKSKLRGCLSGYLAAHYTDMCIKDFFDDLKANSLLDNTIIVISSDHGSSCAPTPVRTRPIMNFYEENYHIPILIGGSGVTKFHDKRFHMSKDLLPTIVEICGLRSPYSMSGQSILSDQAAREVLIEHLGPGQPDLFERDIWFSVRNAEFAVSYMVKLKEEFREGRLISVYNLRDDPKEMKNLVSKTSDCEVERLLKKIENRHNELRNKYLHREGENCEYCIC